MGDQLFEDAEVSRNYQDYRPNYIGLGLEKEVASFMGITRTLPQNAGTLALDVGCGNGQLTRVLAPLFTKMIGIDRSKSQIDVAIEVTSEENVEYRVNLAEDLSFLQDGTVDLVSAAAATITFTRAIPR
ncbi:putative methyltransferase [Apostichopus japonicus]|uniref:Putative methyltransferase n=1 Tax=Stichopus japonicus TaxID=307972 RepID=A0A2G8K0K6_STIJA|nr:putative methyltransferase [Apostichopus japonicus]